MEYKKLYNLLNAIFPTCHIDWSGSKEVPDYPYIAIVDEPTNNVGADNKVYHKCESYTVELYSKKNNYQTAEEKIENMFDNNNIYWNKERIWLKDLKVFETVYEI